jgi:multicomponent Na+:H+ antiporter subunit E
MKFPRRAAAARQWSSMLWLIVVWVLLWGTLSWANVLSGAVLAFLITVGFPMPSINYQGRVRPLRLVHLIARFLWDITRASLHVAWLAIRPKQVPTSAMIGVELRSANDLYMTLTSDLCCLVPGSIVVEAHRLTGRIYLHYLDVSTPEEVERARQAVLGQEKRVLLALASDAELAAAGLDSRGRELSPVAGVAPVAGAQATDLASATGSEPGDRDEPTAGTQSGDGVAI